MKMRVRSSNFLFFIMLAIAVTSLLTVFCYIAGLPLIIPALLLFCALYLFCFAKVNGRLLMQMGLQLTLIVFTAHCFKEYYTDISYLYIPVASVAILTTLLYSDIQLGFMMSLLSSVCVSLIVGGDFHFMLVSFIGSLAGAYAVCDARTRGKLIEAGLLVGLTQVVCSFLLNPAMQLFLVKDYLLTTIKPLFLNGLISAFVVIATLKIFETLFGVLTNFSLLELADFNQPLLRRLVLEAPGTYHHSLMVSNIAEAASDVIGANALLTRVGAYYHDIGKIEKPEYFTENQLHDNSKHDHIEPSISRLVILNHVKDGIELARRYKLNERIIDFIPQHHGTSLIHYFYQKALEDASVDETVDQENFRYAGPKPRSRETAIVLLADSVEGAVRTLSDPSPGHIDELVRKIINNKFIDGQLDECDLTLREIEKISSTFVRVLSAIHHTRVKYPEKKNGNSHKKSAEANSSSPSAPHQNNQGRSAA